MRPSVADQEVVERRADGALDAEQAVALGVAAFAEARVQADDDARGRGAVGRDVEAVGAVQEVGAGAAVELVVAAEAAQPVVAAEPGDPVGLAGAVERVAVGGAVIWPWVVSLLQSSRSGRPSRLSGRKARVGSIVSPTSVAADEAHIASVMFLSNAVQNNIVFCLYQF